MSWQLAIALSIIANVTTMLVQRRYSLNSKVPETFPTATSYLLGVMPVGILIGLSLPHEVDWSRRLFELLILCSGSMAISGWIGFRAVKELPVVAFQTIGRFTSVVAIALGWLVLGETLNGFQLVGAAILMAAALMAIWAPAGASGGASGKFNLRAVVLTLVAATLLAISLVTEKAILGHMQVGGVLIFGWGSQTLAMILLATKDARAEHLRKLTTYEVKWSALMGLANGVAGAFYVYALNRSNNISLITALTAVTLPLLVLGAHLVLGERDNSKLMWLSLATCFVGLLIGAV
jgi:drug/metabolite transporter (DMT)-like permease